MTSVEVENTLPTLDRLGATVPDDLDAPKAAQEWLTRFSDAVASKDVSVLLTTIRPDGWWRDLVALTWDIRTFHGAENMKQFLQDRLIQSQFSVNPTVSLAMASKPFPDLCWLVLQFQFETAGGAGVATSYLVPTSTGEWQAFVVCTELVTVKGTQTTFGPGRDARMLRGDEWMAERKKERAFEDCNPDVLIIGAGHAGMDAAARLKSMGVTSLIVEKNARVGDQWRRRYDSLRLQDVVCK